MSVDSAVVILSVTEEPVVLPVPEALERDATGIFRLRIT